MRRRFSLSKLFKRRPRVRKGQTNIKKRKFSKSELEDMIKKAYRKSSDRNHVTYGEFSKEVYENELRIAPPEKKHIYSRILGIGRYAKNSPFEMTKPDERRLLKRSKYRDMGAMSK